MKPEKRCESFRNTGLSKGNMGPNYSISIPEAGGRSQKHLLPFPIIHHRIMLNSLVVERD